MGIIRITGTRTEKPKPTQDLCERSNTNLTLIESTTLKLKERSSNTAHYQLMLDTATNVCEDFTLSAKQIKTVASREIRDCAAKLLNTVLSIQEIEEVEGGILGTKLCKKYKNLLISEVEDLRNLFMSSYELDLHDFVPKKKAKKTEVVEQMIPKRNQKQQIRVGSFSDLNTVTISSKVTVTKEDLDSDEYDQSVRELDLTEKRSKHLDSSDQDALVLSKYKGFIKQIRFEDEYETGLSFMPTIPILAICTPSLYTEVMDPIGIKVDNVGGYPVFPKQLMVGMQASHTDSLTIAKDEKVAKYILSTAHQYLDGKYEIIGDPKWIKGMICFWLVQKSEITKIRIQFPRFKLQDWVPVCLPNK